MSIAGQVFIVRCGAHGLFLGVGSKVRAGSLELARKFTRRIEAEAAARQLRSRCEKYELPWTVQQVSDQPGGAA